MYQQIQTPSWDLCTMWHTYGDDFPIGSVDERVLAVHVVVVREVGFLDLTND